MLYLAASASLAATDMQQSGAQALVAGEPGNAAQAARVLLSADPDNFAALMLLALAQSDLGETAAAISTAGRAFRAAPDDETRLQAARLVAAVHFRMGQYARSEIWLRRASNLTRTEAEAEAVAREYYRAAQANPLSIQTTASIAPSNNINNGSIDGILRFEGIDLELQLPEDRRALSGIAYTGSVRLGYRLSQDERQATTAGLFLFGETYTLSREARTLLDASPAPRVRALDGHDFRSFVGEVELAHGRNDLSPFGPVSGTVAFGAYGEGGEHLVNYQDLALQQIIPVGRDQRVTLGGSVRWQQAVSDAVLDAVVYDLNAASDSRLPNQDQLQLSLAARHRDAGFENTYEEYRTGIAYAFAEPVLTVRWSTAFEIGYRSYDDFATTLDGRRDRFATLQAMAVLENITYFGFSPNVMVKATRTQSSASEYTTSGAEIRVGVQSNF